jgi:uncharacterized radical SAM protein YgiQ
VGIITQPDWNDPDAITVMGRPRLFFGITAGNLDSMLAHYTAFKRKRSSDGYTPGGKAGQRPDRATIVYSNLVRQVFGAVPVILGGIEASLRKLVHYDYWDDGLRESVLVDSGADLLVYGMGEYPVLEIADQLKQGCRLTELASIPGTAVKVKEPDPAGIRLADRESYNHHPFALVKDTALVARFTHGVYGEQPLFQKSKSDSWVKVNPPRPPLSTVELDRVYDLPYSRQPHPIYQEEIPGFRTTAFSIISHRGCPGGCTFCSLAFHQGRRIRSRSYGSVLQEVRSLQRQIGFKGIISDIGGPTANSYGYRCTRKDLSSCARLSCLYPSICTHFKEGKHKLDYLLQKAVQARGIRKVFISSGVRHDLLLKNRRLLKKIVQDHVSGHLKVAPEHCHPEVLAVMGKCSFCQFEEFQQVFRDLSRQAGREQYLVPYFISGHPGCTEQHMRVLSDYLKKGRWKVQQVQSFIPLPGTLAAAFYFSGRDLKGNCRPAAKTIAQKRKQFGYLMWYKKPGNSGKQKRRRKSNLYPGVPLPVE